MLVFLLIRDNGRQTVQWQDDLSLRRCPETLSAFLSCPQLRGTVQPPLGSELLRGGMHFEDRQIVVEKGDVKTTFTRTRWSLVLERELTLLPRPTLTTTGVPRNQAQGGYDSRMPMTPNAKASTI